MTTLSDLFGASSLRTVYQVSVYLPDDEIASAISIILAGLAEAEAG